MIIVHYHNDSLLWIDRFETHIFNSKILDFTNWNHKKYG